jgi:hypothetical protein
VSWITIVMEESPLFEGADTSATPYRLSTDRFWLPITGGKVSPNPQHMSRDDENRGLVSPIVPIKNAYEPGGEVPFRLYPNAMPPFLEAGGFVGTVTQGDGTNEQQTVTPTGTPTAGTFDLTWDSVTVTLAWNATASQVQKALVANIPSVLEGDIVVTGGPLDTGAFTFDFEGQLAGQDVAQIASDDTNLTGATLADATATPGATGTVLDPDGNGLEAGSYLVQFSTKRTGATAKSMEVIQGMPEHSVFHRLRGAGVSQFSFDHTGQFNASLMGLHWADIPDPGLTAAYDAPVIEPLRRGSFKLTWNSGSAALDEFSLQMTNPLARGEDLSRKTFFPSLLEHTGEPPTMTGSVNMRTVDQDDFDALMAASTFSTTATWCGPTKIGSTGKFYSVWVECPSAVYTGGETADMTNGRRFPASFQWMAGYDAVAGYDVRITIACAVSSIETFA